MASSHISAKSGEASICLIAENRLFRDTLARLLRKQSGIRVTGVLSNTENIHEQIFDSGCDMIVTDCSPVHSNSQLFSSLNESSAPPQIVFIGMDDDAEVFLQAIYLGARGYVLKDASAAEIIASVRGVARGEAACPPRLYVTLMEHIRNEPRRNPQFIQPAGKAKSTLTHRQVQLMDLVAKGLTNKEIAANLNLSQFTVKNHIRRVMRQVEAATRHDAVDAIRATSRFSLR